MKLLAAWPYLFFAASVFAQTLPTVANNEAPWWIWPLILVIGIAVIVVVLIRRGKVSGGQVAAAAGNVGGQAHDALASVLDLFHKHVDNTAVLVNTNAAQAAVIGQPVVQRAVESLPQPTQAGAAANAAPAAGRLVADQPAPAPAAAPTGAPAMTMPTVIPLLFKGKERDADFIYPDEPGYDWSAFDGGGPGANYKGEPLRRQWLGLPRADHGNPNYVDGQANTTPATEEQKSLARRTSALLGVDNVAYLETYNTLLASTGGDARKAAAILGAYSTSDS